MYGLRHAITGEGEIHAYQFYPAVMHSHARFTYTEVAAILSNTKGLEARKYKARVNDLLHLHGNQSLLSARNRRGAMDLETVETQIICEKMATLKKSSRARTQRRPQVDRRRMLAANVCAADFITRNKQTGCTVRTRRPHTGKSGNSAQLSESPGHYRQRQRRTQVLKR